MMTHFLKGDVFWRIHHSADIFFNLCALSTSLRVRLSTGIARAHICQRETSTARFCTDKTLQISHREYAKFQSILSTCKLLQSQFSPFHSQLWPLKDAFCKGSLKAPLYTVLKPKISEMPLLSIYSRLI